MKTSGSKISAFVLIFLLSSARISAALELSLTARETEGFTRRSEPVSLGVILPRGAARSLEGLRILDSGGKSVPCQFEATSTWPDGSTKWLLADFIAGCPANGASSYTLTDRKGQAPSGPAVKVEDEAGQATVSTGILRCTLDKDHFNLFSRVWLDHDRNGNFEESEEVTSPKDEAAVKLTDQRGRPLASRWGKVRSFEVESAGPVRATVAVKGEIADQDGEPGLDYTARISFYAGSGLVRIFFTLANHRPASILNDVNGDKHWVMGRPGSYFFEEMSLTTALRFEGPIVLSVGDGGRELLDRVVLTDEGGIYQESSGGENWFNRIHMNADMRIPMRFRGGRTFLGEVEPYPVERPEAWLQVADRKFGLAVAVRWFWQNFPKALSADPEGRVRVGLWPGEFPDLHELQGGEIKTHEVAFYFHTGPQGSTPAENRVATVMAAFHYPLYVRASAESYLADGFFDDTAPYDPQRFPRYESMMQGGLTGQPRNLNVDIDRADEYGWRNWGDTPARNEYDESGGPHTGRQAASHFNHEYDHGYSMILHSLRTAGLEPSLSLGWWRLAEPALWHESDIDVYHTTADSTAHGAYNGGKFAHTSHGVEVVNASHRGSPALVWWGKLHWPWGQGQSPESGHFNNRGMLACYYLTGNRTLKESALEQADLVYYKVSGDVFSQIGEVNRDAGNNLQILTDAYLLTWNEKYVAAAEKIIASTAPGKQWYLSEKGRKENPDRTVEGFWQDALCINPVGRWTAVMEEKTGQPYSLGRNYLQAYADFVSRFLSGGVEKGIYASWSPSGGGKGNLGPWTYRVVDVLMYGHKYSADPELRKRCLKAADEAFAFMRAQYPGNEPLYYDSKFHTILAGGGHEYTYFKRYGGWPEIGR